MPGGVTSVSCTVSNMTSITPSPHNGTITYGADTPQNAPRNKAKEGERRENTANAPGHASCRETDTARCAPDTSYRQGRVPRTRALAVLLKRHQQVVVDPGVHLMKRPATRTLAQWCGPRKQTSVHTAIKLVATKRNKSQNSTQSQHADPTRRVDIIIGGSGWHPQGETTGSHSVHMLERKARRDRNQASR